MRAGTAIVLGLVLALGGDARADENDGKRWCATEHESTQRLRMDGKLRVARTTALSCAQERCPAVVRIECAKLLTELDGIVPTILPEVRGADGVRIVDASLEIDGVPVGRFDGRAIPLDPGEHALRVIARDGRSVEHVFIVLEGELRKHVVVELGPRVGAEASAIVAVPAGPMGSGVGAEPVITREPTSGRATPWPVFALGGTALAALGTFAFFGLRGYREQVSLEASCAPACAPGADDGMRRDYLVADVALGVGLVALVGAAWVYFAHDGARPHSVAIPR